MSQPELPSGIGVTAVAVAKERSVESERADRLFQDDLAGAFCTAVREAAGDSPAVSYDITLSEYLPMMRGYMALRTRYFDEACLEACAAGCRQGVILAAGLDARAFRLPWPPGVRLFEVDSAQMLAFKRHVLERRGIRPACERHELVADLRTDWASALRAAGFEPQQPTVWLIEGLLIYLSNPDNDRLLETVGTLSAPGSRLVLEHADTRVMKQPEMMRSRAESLDVHGVHWESGIDEPVAWLRRHGWSGQEVEPRAYASALGRSLPPVMDASAGKGRLWWATGRR